MTRAAHRADEVTTRSAWRVIGPLALLGTCGSLLMAVAAPRLVGDPSVHWWYEARIPPGRTGGMVAFYLGMAMLVGSWSGIGLLLGRAPSTRVRDLRAVAVAWGLPLLAAPPLFSADMYSYLAQGTILHLGLDPYHVAPVVLARHGGARVLSAVSPFWRKTTAPYGPAFLGLMSLVVATTGSHLVAGVVLARLTEVVGIVLLAVAVPRLARAVGADPRRATWLAVASPLVLLELVAAGHNDALMAGLMVCGVVLAYERHPLLGVATCALATTVKVPAAAAAVVVVVAWARSVEGGRARARFVVAALAVFGAIVGGVSAATGVGLGWISTTVLSTPGKVHLAVTPSTAFGWTLAAVLHGMGVSVSAHSLESVAADVALGAAGIACLAQLWRVRTGDLAVRLAVILLLAALGGPAAWPWYFSWGVVLLAAWAPVQRSGVLAAALGLSVLLVKPDGILALPLQSAPATLAVYVAAAAAAVWMLRRAHTARPNPRSAADRASGATRVLTGPRAASR